ncbi:hypothetical protein B0A54_04067 [Friedmanniomyces endolithicus]|uniref:NAD-dependent epimerase/dehydratase domain-containing protein n=1 Tax=Friedmanniomyces endolithicus TaxID=329885 RepID=A0A4U0V9G5_9PEZI|nr:hypothetical protein B0A54_04067 [Friedmanniomyces endolithicus]
MAPGSEQLPLQNKGIFHNLPTFSPELKDLTAIVTGANGISGFHTMRVLLESPQRWKKVWAASRRPPPEEMMALLSEEQRARVEHVACDFLAKPEEIAAQLKDKGVKAEYIFFYSYAQPKPKPGAGAVTEHSTAMLTGYLSEWAVLNDKCKNNKFNSSDTCPIPNNRLWPELARWYGCKGYGGPELDESKLNVIDPGDVPTPLGFGPSRKLRYAWTLSGWAQDPANAKAWKEIMEKHKVTHNPFNDIEAHFTFGDFAAWGPAFALSMNKARCFGWTGHVDTLESLHLAYSELSKIGMLPPPVADAKPMI